MPSVILSSTVKPKNRMPSYITRCCLPVFYVELVFLSKVKGFKRKRRMKFRQIRKVTDGLKVSLKYENSDTFLKFARVRKHVLFYARQTTQATLSKCEVTS